MLPLEFWEVLCFLPAPKFLGHTLSTGQDVVVAALGGGGVLGLHWLMVSVCVSCPPGVAKADVLAAQNERQVPPTRP